MFIVLFVFQTVLRNQSTLTPIFWRAVYFHFKNITWHHWYDTDRCVLPDNLSTYFEW